MLLIAMSTPLVRGFVDGPLHDERCVWGGMRKHILTATKSRLWHAQVLSNPNQTPLLCIDTN